MLWNNRNDQKGLSVFLVEDNELYSMMIDQKFKDQENYNLTSFTTSKECIDNLHMDPDIIILDYYLPDADGMETLKKIKKIKPETRVIILSKQQDIQVALDLLEKGAHDYILKDKTAINRLNNAIHRIASKKELESELLTMKFRLNKYVLILGVSLLVMLGLVISVLSVILTNLE